MMRKCAITGVPTTNIFRSKNIHPYVIEVAKKRRDEFGGTMKQSLVDIRLQCEKAYKRKAKTLCWFIPLPVWYTRKLSRNEWKKVVMKVLDKCVKKF